MYKNFANISSSLRFPRLPNNNELVIFDNTDTPDFTLNGTKLVCNNAGNWNLLAQYQLVNYSQSLVQAQSQIDGWVRVNGVNIENSDATSSVNNIGGVNVLTIGISLYLKVNDTVEWGIRSSSYDTSEVVCVIDSYTASTGVIAPSIILTAYKILDSVNNFKNYTNLISNINYPSLPNRNEFIKFTNTDNSDFTLNNTRIVCNNPGTWNFIAQYQAYSYKTTNLGINSELDGWVSLNGVNIENSDASWSSTLLNELGVLTIGTIIELKVGDYVEFGVRSSSLDNNLNIGIINYLTPTSITAPSIILTTYKVKEPEFNFKNYANIVSFSNLPLRTNDNELCILNKIDTSDFTVDNATRLVVKNPGKWVFLSQYQLYSYDNNITGPNGLVDGWFRVNGVNVPNSDATSSSAVLSGVNVLPIALVVDLKLNDYVEFGVRSTSLNNKVTTGIKELLPQTRINAPSLILSAHKI